LPLKHGVAHLPPLLFVASRFLAGADAVAGRRLRRPPGLRLLWQVPC